MESDTNEHWESKSDFFPTPDVQLDYFSRNTPKLGIPVEMAHFLWNLL